ncbi:hypothetical protein HZC07_05095 [Candidatus Micrarchaeota archaeon]|nr:hypothetical protein [Candidatus Micrarchaeota archaeon]
MEITKENLLKKGNSSIAIGTLWGLGSIVHPCPLCVVTTGTFIVNGIKEKLGMGSLIKIKMPEVEKQKADSKK